MANLKLDLQNKLQNEKYYEELELVRLAGDPNMNYKEKIHRMSVSMEKIALLNAELGLIQQYFQDPPQQPDNAPAPKAPVETPKTHQGQTHGE